MLSQISETCSVALLSNTNSIHWHMVDPDGLFRRLFDHVFLSFEVGYAKPHRDIFDHLLNTVPDNPGDILFLDDTAENVEAAVKLGIRATQISGPDGIEKALELSSMRSFRRAD